MKLNISEIFYSLQGEGARAGTPTIFIRLQGCKAKFACLASGVKCDTEFESGRAWELQEIESWIERATPNTIILLLEPASRLVNQKFLALRDLLCQKISILLPCTHAKACPALIDDEWCHEEHPYKAPSAYWNLVREMGFRRNLLQFSMLALGKQASQFKREDARMVSRTLKSKGRCEKWLCADGKRWKESQLNRNQNEKNEAFFEAARGDIIDCLSTGINLPD